MAGAAPSSPPPNRLFALLAAAVVVLGVGVIAVLASARGGDGPAADPTAAVEVAGDPLDPVGRTVPGGPIDPTTDSAVGQRAPDLTGTDFGGSTVSVTADGRFKAVHFLAHWCQHCQAEVPLLAELVAEGAVPAELDLYAVSTRVDDTRPNFPPDSWLEGEALDVPTIRDDGDDSAYRAFGAGGLPYVVILDGDNRVVSRSHGELGTQGLADLWTSALASSPAGDSSESGDDG